MNDEKEISCRDLSTQEDLDNTNITTDEEEASRAGTGLRERSPRRGSDPSPGNRYSKVPNEPARYQPPDRNIADKPEENTANINVPEISIDDIINQLDRSSVQLELDGNLKLEETSLLALGKSSLVMNNRDFAGSINELENTYYSFGPAIEDKVKYFNGSFYVLQNNNDLTLFKNESSKPLIKLKTIYYSGPLASSLGHSVASREVYEFSFTKRFDNTDTIDTLLKISLLYGGTLSKTTVQGLKAGTVVDRLSDYSQIFNDHTFVLQTPFENNETLKNINLIGASIIDIDPEYNFYIKEYEKIATKNNRSSKENVFPNLYLLTSVNEDNKNNELLNSVVTLKNSVKNGNKFILNRNAKQLENVKNAKVMLGAKNNVGEYFDNFGLNYNKFFLRDPELHKLFVKKMENIVFLTDTTTRLNTINEKKYLFPMNIEFSIPTDKTTNITKMLYDCSLMDNFIIKLFDLYTKNDIIKQEEVVSEKLIDQKIDKTINNNTQQPKVNVQFSSKRKTFNHYLIGDLLEELNQDPIPNSDENHIVIGNTKQYLRSNSSSMKFINSLRTKIFQGKLETFIKKNSRTYREILNGKKSYNETIAFRLSKYIKGQNEPIQNYWIPNNPDLDVLKVVDTQIKYEQEYTYKLFAFQFVLGNSYRHQIIQHSVGPDKNFILLVDQAPDPRIVEVELLSTDKKVVDNPPLSPEIEFIPYAGIDNKIGLFLNGRTGEEKLEPILIFPNDSQKISTYDKTLDNKVIYKSDDVAKRFEIMKLDMKPRSYDDFKSGYIKIAETDINPLTAQSATAASFIDSIEPNKKYYYAFRAVDVHDKISNPSPVYEIEIINDNGTILPVIKNFEFENPKYQNALEMRRFLKITPATQHTILDKEKSKIDKFNTAKDALGSVILGVSNFGNPWDKTFKLVATSKQTGKKIEIKFKFNYILE